MRYSVSSSSRPSGMKVITRSSWLQTKRPGTRVSLRRGFREKAAWVEARSIGWLKVTVMAWVRATWVAPLAGSIEST
jgi:hypothetical protein